MKKNIGFVLLIIIILGCKKTNIIPDSVVSFCEDPKTKSIDSYRTIEDLENEYFNSHIICDGVQYKVFINENTNTLSKFQILGYIINDIDTVVGVKVKVNDGVKDTIVSKYIKDMGNLNLYPGIGLTADGKLKHKYFEVFKLRFIHRGKDSLVLNIKVDFKKYYWGQGRLLIENNEKLYLPPHYSDLSIIYIK